MFLNTLLMLLILLFGIGVLALLFRRDLKKSERMKRGE